MCLLLLKSKIVHSDSADQTLSSLSLAFKIIESLGCAVTIYHKKIY